MTREEALTALIIVLLILCALLMVWAWWRAFGLSVWSNGWFCVVAYSAKDAAKLYNSLLEEPPDLRCFVEVPWNQLLTLYEPDSTKVRRTQAAWKWAKEQNRGLLCYAISDASKRL